MKVTPARVEFDENDIHQLSIVMNRWAESELLHGLRQPCEPRPVLVKAREWGENVLRICGYTLDDHNKWERK